MSFDIRELYRVVALGGASDVEGHLSLLEELFLSLLELFAGEFVDLEAVDNLPLTALADHGERVYQSRGDSVGISVADHANAGILTGLGADPPVMHVVAGSVGGGGCARLLHHRDDLGSPLRNLGNEGLIQVLVVLDCVSDALALAADCDLAVVDVWVLGQGVVAPNDHVLDILHRDLQLVAQLGESAVLVQSGEGGEVLLWDRRRVVGRNEGVGVGRIAYNEHLDVLLSELIDGFALGLEDLSVRGQEVLALHAGATRLSPDKDGNISLVEGLLHLGGRTNVSDQWESAVLELHHESLQGSLGNGELEQLENDFLVGSEHASLSDHEAQDGADLAGGTCDSDSHRLALLLLAYLREVSPERLKALNRLGVFHVKDLWLRFNDYIGVQTVSKTSSITLHVTE